AVRSQHGRTPGRLRSVPQDRLRSPGALAEVGEQGWVGIAAFLQRGQQARRRRPALAAPAMHRPGGGLNSEHAAEYPGALISRSSYLCCMISPIRGDLTGFRVQVSSDTEF